MTHTMEIDGVEVTFSEGETILEIANRSAQHLIKPQRERHVLSGRNTIRKKFQRSATTQGLSLSVGVAFVSSN